MLTGYQGSPKANLIALSRLFEGNKSSQLLYNTIPMAFTTI